MKDGLLREEVSHQDGGQYLKVRMFIKGDIFAGNANADEPIFKKGDFSYDKYELAKIISFQQLEMLVRPFKNNPYYKRYNLLTGIWLAKSFLAVVVFFTVASVVLLIIKDQQLYTLWKNGLMLFSVILFFVSMVYIYWIINMQMRVKRQFQRYCEDFSTENGQIKIIAYKTHSIWNPLKYAKLNQKFPDKYSLFFSMIRYLQISSLQVPIEEKSVKLYHKQFYGTIGCNPSSEPLFNSEQFRLDKERLQKIIAFESLQLIFQPFKQKESFKRLSFWLKMFLSTAFSVFLMIIPPLIKQDELYLKIQLISIMVITLSACFLSLYKMHNIGLLVDSEFLSFCNQINMRQTNIQIITHMFEANEQRRQISPKLYCLEVKEYNR